MVEQIAVPAAIPQMMMRIDNLERRLEGLLPAHFEVNDVVLMEEYEADRWRIRERFRLGG